MNRRRMASAAAAAVLGFSGVGLAGCGGGGSSTLSVDEFVDELSDICNDTEKDLDDLTFPEDAAGTEQFAGDVIEIYTEAKERLSGLNPPDDLARDFTDFKDVVDDELKLLGDLEDAGKDEDEAEIAEILGRFEKFDEERTSIAEDLDVDDCTSDDSEPTDTTTADTTPASTTPAATTTPETTPSTLPPTPLTLPSTLPPATVPAVTEPATTGQLFTVIDVATDFSAPAGFTLQSKTPDQATLDAVTASDLNVLMESFGVATLIDDEGTEVADVWVGVALLEDPGMPAAWKDLDCGGAGNLRQSEGGILGIVCEAALESPFWEIFTATQGVVGISVYTRLPNIGGDLVADAFLEANR